MQPSAERLQWNRANGHLVRSDGDAYLMHVPTTAVYGVDDLELELIALCGEPHGASVDEMVVELAPRFAPARVRALAEELRNLEMLQPSGSLRPINPAGVKVQN